MAEKAINYCIRKELLEYKHYYTNN